MSRGEVTQHQWLSAQLQRVSTTHVSEWCEGLGLLPSSLDVLWEDLDVLAKACPPTTKPLPSAEALEEFLWKMCLAVQEKLQPKDAPTPWQAFLLHDTCVQCVRVIRSLPSNFPFIVRSGRVLGVLDLWKTQSASLAAMRSALVSFFAFGRGVMGMVAPVIPSLAFDTRGGSPLRLLKLARNICDKVDFEDVQGFCAAQLAFTLSRMNSRVTQCANFNLRGNFAQIPGIEKGLTRAAEAEVADGAQLVPTRGGVGSGTVAVLVIDAIDGRSLVALDAASGARLGRVDMPRAISLVHGVPFTNVAGVVEVGNKMSLWQWVPKTKRWGLQLRIDVPAAGPVTWARMIRDPPLLAWGRVTPFDGVLASAGEVSPLTDVSVAEWRVQESVFSATTVKESLQQFDAFFGSVREGSDQPAALNAMAHRRAVVWVQDRIVLKIDNSNIVSCWRAGARAIVCAQSYPAALLVVTDSGRQVGVSLCDSVHRIALLDAFPLVA